MATTTDDEGSLTHRELVQKRLALLGAVGFAINLLGTFAQLLDAEFDLWSPTLWAMLAIGAVQAGVYVICRGPARSSTFLRTLEAVTLLLVAIASGIIAHALPAQNLAALGSTADAASTESFYRQIGPFGAVLYMSAYSTLGLTQTFVLRAALVPSSKRRTLALTVVGGVTLIAVFVAPIPGWAADAQVRAAMPIWAPAVVAAGTAVWWTFTTIVCVVISWVVHGLRREIRQAKRLGQYQLEAKLGEGGMGVVYRAKHALLRRPTAVKVLPPERAEGVDLVRFEREVRATASLTHPNTIRIFDFGHTPGGLFYYAMELLDGASLAEVVERDGAQSAERCVHVLRQVAAALVEAHEAGLIHRDIKPGNVVLCSQGGEHDVPKLLDFGLVKELSGGDVQVSREQSILGTPAYLAPEVIRSHDAASSASDLYALGATGYFLLTGQHVFDGQTVVEICSQHLTETPVPPSRRTDADVPEALEELVLACLAKNPADRPGSARALRDALDTLEGVGEWTEADRAGWWGQHGEALRNSSVALQTDDTLVVDLAERREAS